VEGLTMHGPGNHVIEIADLGIAFGDGGERVEVLKRLDLTIDKGEFVAIVGASGVGKSTLLRILMGLSAPSHGSVKVARDKSYERDMALVFQDSRMLPWRRILANAAFGLEKLPLGKAERNERALAALGTVGLRDLAGRYPRQLSGGQRQRVALARALAVKPAILLMDEPFSALDVGTREALQDEISRIHGETGQTILFVTHDIDEAVYLADRVVALGGKPGEVRSSTRIDIERPRRRGDARLRDIAASIKLAIAAEAASREDWSI
jgi:NitT/TauT family transport system ATP-binding protein